MNDLRQLDDVLDKGTSFFCDHCKRKCVVIVVDTRPRILIAQDHGRG